MVEIRWRWLGLALTTVVVGIGASTALAQQHADPITIRSVDEVYAKRDALVRYIWGATTWTQVRTKQPTATFHNYVPVADDALPDVNSLPNLDRIEKIVIAMNAPSTSGGTVSHTSTAYLFHPRMSDGPVVIVHHGHGCRLDGKGNESHYNLDATIRALLAARYAVVGMRMPLFQNPSECGHDSVSTSHDDMFTNPAQQLQPGSGSPLQFFLEPVAVVLNYIEMTYPNIFFFPHMIGLSGGGWTTTVYAAIDPRVVLSFPVAGSLPFDLPEGSRDSEQRWTDFYNIAGYKDLYVLGSYGQALDGRGRILFSSSWRRQTQILNQHDDCCFRPAPEAADRYVCDVQTTLYTLAPDTVNSGSFVFVYDASAASHQISSADLSGVILPTLQPKLGSSGPAVGSCPMFFAEVLNWSTW